MLQSTAQAQPTGLTRSSINPAEQSSLAAAFSTCCFQGLCLPCGPNGSEHHRFDDLVPTKRRIAKGDSVYRSGDTLAFLYVVRRGAFKSVSVSRQGDVKVTGFHLPRDMLGLDAISAGRHGYDAVALEDSEVCAVLFAALERLSLGRPVLQSHLFRMISSDISRDQGLMLLLGCMSAEQRLAALLLSLSRRYQRLGFAADRFVLRMTREEIGSYLGLTVETVSRVLWRFQREGLIGVHQREIELKNPGRLREMVGQ